MYEPDSSVSGQGPMTGFCGHGDAPSASMKEQKQTTTSPSQELYQRSPNTGTLELKFPLGYPYR